MNKIKHLMLCCFILCSMAGYAQFISATATQNASPVISGTVNSPVIKVQVIVTGGPSVELTQFNFNALGTTDTSEISNLKVFYTGNKDSFSTETPFGDTIPFLFTSSNYDFSITGNQVLNTDTNYFWLTYDIDSAAIPGNTVDAECTSLTVNSMLQTLNISAPAGSRTIRADYCRPSHSNAANSCSNTKAYIAGVSTTGAVNDLNNLNNGCPGSGDNYTFFSSHTLTVKKDAPFGIYIKNGLVNRGYAVWIDYNQDGTFDPISELAYAAMAAVDTFTSGNITIPCSALNGTTRMRIRTNIGGIGIPDHPCSLLLYGESEDYLVEILDNPVVYISHTAVQQTGSASPGNTNKAILRVPVKTDHCGTATIEALYFNTGASTNASNDIVNAKLYTTGNSAVFNTSKLLGTFSFPSGVFAFTISDTLLNNDTTNYWLAYDLISFATAGNRIDAGLDSIVVQGVGRTPVNGNPAGDLEIVLPMGYVSSVVTQNDTSRVGRGDINSEILGIQVVMSATGAPVKMNSINFNANGTTDTSDIRNLKVFYTGNSNVFATTTQFGNTEAYLPSNGLFTISGDLDLANDTNYFWLTYDINATADTTRFVDAECTSVVIEGLPSTPSVTSPSGNRRIRLPYCTPSFFSADYSSILRFNFAGINNVTTMPAPPAYTYFKNIMGTVMQGAVTSVSATFSQNNLIPNWGLLGIWIDFDDNGVFTLAERIFHGNSMTLTLSGTVTIPLTATPGVHRMRVRSTNLQPSTIDPCVSFTTGLNYKYGETEDYLINVVPNVQATYTWNQSANTSFRNAANWTPARTDINLNDVFVFNGSNATVDSVITQTISKVIVENDIDVTLNTTAASQTWTVMDSLRLDSGHIVTNNTEAQSLTLTLGTGINKTGVLSGEGTLDTKLKFTRWVAANTGTVAFPFAAGNDRRHAYVTFTLAPTTGGTITGSYSLTNPGNAGLPLTDTGMTLTKVSPIGYWNFATASGLTGGMFDLTVYAENMPGVTNDTNLTLLQRAAAGNWFARGTYFTPADTTAFPVVTRTDMTVWGQFGIGSDSTVNPLPVKLLSFTAVKQNDDVKLTWSTASEQYNKGFYIERSAGNEHWNTVSFVKGKGNSQVLTTYTTTDIKPFETVKALYYRLRQVDENGAETWSNTVRVSDGPRNAASAQPVIYPNPFGSELYITVESNSSHAATFTITDVTGKLISKQIIQVEEGTHTYAPDILDVRSNGLYFYMLETGTNRYTGKLNKE